MSGWREKRAGETWEGRKCDRERDKKMFIRDKKTEIRED